MTDTTENNTTAIFEQLYLEIREKEKRIYTDEELLYLPHIRKDHPHCKEWQLRKRSAWRLKHYLQKQKAPLKILEVGCGNGWLSHHLATIENCRVIATDINQAETEQAKRVFSHVANLEFVTGGLHAEKVLSSTFNNIVFAASIQYFPSLRELITLCQKYLKPGGEIHILDSPIYEDLEIEAARERTNTYYRMMGYPEMNRWYYHHSWSGLKGLKIKTLYDPQGLRFYLSANRNPFPWICISKENEI